MLKIRLKTITTLIIFLLLSSCASLMETPQSEQDKLLENSLKHAQELKDSMTKTTDPQEETNEPDVLVTTIHNQNKEGYLEVENQSDEEKPITLDKKDQIDKQNCSHEILDEFCNSFEKKYSYWRSVTLLQLTCSHQETGLNLFIKYRAFETICLDGIFANWKVISGSARRLFQTAFHFSEITFVDLRFYNPYLDEFGSKYFRHEVTMQMDRSLADKINWDNITDDMMFNLLNERGLIEKIKGEKIVEK